MTKRIDVHSHFLPDFYRIAADEAGYGKPDGIPGLPAWSEQAAIDMMDRLGIQSALLSISSPGVHFGDDVKARALARRVNEEGARLRDTHGTRFGFFASLPLPDLDGAVAESCYALDVLKADGVVLKTNHHGLYLGDERLAVLFSELNRRKAVIFIHPTSPACSCCSGISAKYPKPVLEFIFETTRSVVDMVLSGALERFADMKVIVPHAGAALPIVADRVELLLPVLGPVGAHAPDVAGQLRKLYYDLAGAPVPKLLGALLQIAAKDRIFYGSDWPFTPVKAVESLLDKLETTPLFDEAARRDVMRGNALALFPRLLTM